MKSLILASLLVLSSNVFASKLVTIKSLTNTKLDAASSELVGMDLVTHSTLKKVIELKGKGATAQEIRMNTVAQALHSVCPFFDDGVSIGINTKDEKGTLNAVADLIDSSSVDKGDAAYNQVVRNVSIFNAEAGVEVYSGSASGNNTMGTVLGIYDTKTNEVAVFASTNCGRDD
jgi:hypothetical protein